MQYDVNKKTNKRSDFLVMLNSIAGLFGHRGQAGHALLGEIAFAREAPSMLRVVTYV